jgi:hypothetical protein
MEGKYLIILILRKKLLDLQKDKNHIATFPIGFGLATII